MTRHQARLTLTVTLLLTLSLVFSAWAGPPTDQLREGVARVVKLLHDPALASDQERVHPGGDRRLSDAAAARRGASDRPTHRGTLSAIGKKQNRHGCVVTTAGATGRFIRLSQTEF